MLFLFFQFLTQWVNTTQWPNNHWDHVSLFELIYLLVWPSLLPLFDHRKRTCIPTAAANVQSLILLFVLIAPLMWPLYAYYLTSLLFDLGKGHAPLLLPPMHKDLHYGKVSRQTLVKSSQVWPLHWSPKIQVGLYFGLVSLSSLPTHAPSFYRQQFGGEHGVY